jgi:predicted phosphodiesterase
MSSQQPQRQTSTFLIMSDTHNLETADFNPQDCPLANKLPKVDVLLHCGDLTQVGGLSAYKKALRLMSSYDAEVSIFPTVAADTSTRIRALAGTPSV